MPRVPSATAKKGSTRPPKAPATRAGTHPRTSTGVRDTNRHEGNTVRQEAALRWLTCHALLSYAIGERVSFRRLGDLLAHEFPWRKRAYDQSITFRIASGERAIRLEDVIAFVRVLRRHGVTVDPGWLAFGDESNAAPPDPELVAIARLSMAED